MASWQPIRSRLYFAAVGLLIGLAGFLAQYVGEAGPETRVPPVALSRMTSGGVTTAIGVLGTDDAIRSPAELVTVARGLNAEGLTAYCMTGGYHIPPVTVTGSVRLDLVLIDLILGVGEVAPPAYIVPAPDSHHTPVA